MQILQDVILNILLFAIFAISHSFLASLHFKSLIRKKFGNWIAFYRLIYNFLSIILFSLFLIYSPKSYEIVYDIPYPYDFIVYILQILALFGLVWTLKYVDLKEFIGINQIKRFIQKNYNQEYDELYSFRIEGPYKISRHPIYLFSILFIVLRPYMTLTYFIWTILIIIYFYIGSYFEEKKLTQLFGEKYIAYKNEVSRIFPIKWIVKGLL
jgi:protein-S-isoprenylcysteine O-methyltransferase Ste14